MGWLILTILFYVLISLIRPGRFSENYKSPVIGIVMILYGVKNLTMGINLRRRLSLGFVNDASQDISPPYWPIWVLFSSWN